MRYWFWERMARLPISSLRYHRWVLDHSERHVPERLRNEDLVS